MGFTSRTEITNASMSDRTEAAKWLVEAAGKTYFGSQYDRPRQRVGDKACYVSIKPPYYGDGYGWGGGTSAITVSETGSGDTPVGNIYVREVFFRELTNERSAYGQTFGPFTLSGGKELTIRSTAPVPSTEQLVSHREFYVSYPDSPGVFYQWQKIPYTITPAGDVTDATSFTFENLAKRRPLEASGETGLFPAVVSAEYRFGRLWGAGQATRLPFDCAVTVTNGSAVAVMSGNNTWDESDHYRAITYTGASFTDGSGRYFTDGMTIAFVTQVLSDTEALLTFPDLAETWAYSTKTFTNGATEPTSTFRLDGRGRSDLYCTPVYLGEAYAGISNGMATWTPLNTIRDQNIYEKSGRTVFVAGAGQSLLIGYERGIGLMRSRYSTDNPPQVEFFPLSEEVGTFNPRAVWADNDRNVAFQANGRFWMVAGSRLVDISKQMGIASFPRKFLGGAGRTLKDQRMAWNSERNSLLIVGLSKVGDAATHRYGLHVCFDQGVPTLHPVRFPMPAHCAVSVPREVDGAQVYEWFIGSDDGRILTYGTPGITSDSYYDDSDVLRSDQPISYIFETGAYLQEWKTTLKMLGLVVDADASSYSVSLALKVNRTSNLANETTLATITLSKDTLELGLPTTQADNVRAFRVRLSGTNAGEDFGLISAGVWHQPIAHRAT